jgi:hypothetical protein
MLDNPDPADTLNDEEEADNPSSMPAMTATNTAAVFTSRSSPTGPSARSDWSVRSADQTGSTWPAPRRLPPGVRVDNSPT